MKILVFIKQTFDTEEKITIDNGKISDQGVTFILNPYDEYAIEEAVVLKETFGGEITVIAMGHYTEEAIRTALAMGADKAIVIDDETSEGDEFTVSKVLAAIAEKETYELILCGCMSIDNGSAQIGARLAEELGIPHILTITKLLIDGNKVLVEKDAEGDTEIIESHLPILLTTQQGLNEPRYPSLPGLMKAKKKPIQHVSVNDLEITLDQMKAKTIITEQYLPNKKKAGKILGGELLQQVKELTAFLQEEVKVI
ncbi:electron transfer flavoprotein subunit beta/FixA family protein [Brevibacillus fluminis]|uniref:Electron transfer flavoprotein subunit beta n=1 Tax=Brevibacillus fluminis TaxID=511487 RepID=A0A3M8DKL5_9BACL|nr:electron transfer flavoprotein subunit beta/FixA family protein [Brevibacillus fluminis]RNB87647.1 electron transfer flavoprotein subunit beta/FixA family protein [Brevibacillus fluminis]